MTLALKNEIDMGLLKGVFSSHLLESAESEKSIYNEQGKKRRRRIPRNDMLERDFVEDSGKNNTMKRRKRKGKAETSLVDNESSRDLFKNQPSIHDQK